MSYKLHNSAYAAFEVHGLLCVVQVIRLNTLPKRKHYEYSSERLDYLLTQMIILYTFLTFIRKRILRSLERVETIIGALAVADTTSNKQTGCFSPIPQCLHQGWNQELFLFIKNNLFQCIYNSFLKKQCFNKAI